MHSFSTNAANVDRAYYIHHHLFHLLQANPRSIDGPGRPQGKPFRLTFGLEATAHHRCSSRRHGLGSS